MDETASDKMTISIKTPKEKHDIEIAVTSTVKELKELAAERFKCALEQLCLIFAGKILKDGDTLEQHGIKDGLTVHLVIKTTREQPASQPEAASPASSASPANPPQPSAGTGGQSGMGDPMGLSGLGLGSGTFQEMQQRMQREMMSNPDMMQQMLENPFVSQMMSNPDVMRQLIVNNPQMRDVMERNPEINHMLNNPDLMRQTMELARNPSMMQELMRSQDRAMSNLESLPGGYNALERMYRDIQEPMMSAAQDSLGANPFASLLNASASSGTPDAQQGRENSDPLPNPWGGSGGATTETSTTTTSSSTTSTSSSSSTHGLLGAQGSMFSSPGMQSLMQQMQQNPQMIQNMMQAPYMQTMLQSMAANPDLATQIMGNNPMLAGNPQLMEQFRTQLPTMMQQMNNPGVQAAMGNPRVMDAMLQIQRGMQTLQSEAPTLMPGMTPPGAPTSTSTTTSSSSPTPPTPSSPSPAVLTTTTTTTSGGSPNPLLAPPPAGGQDAFNNMMAQLTGMMAGGQINQPPEQRYASQLEQLTTMGFVDREANILALTATLGDVNAAIDRLLQQR